MTRNGVILGAMRLTAKGIWHALGRALLGIVVFIVGIFILSWLRLVLNVFNFVAALILAGWGALKNITKKTRP